MLIRREILKKVAEGSVTLQFRRWQRPTVKPGGTLRTSLGVLAIGAVEPIALTQINAAEARRAGSPSLAALRAELAGHAGTVYRIEVSLAGADPRVALREALPDAAQVAELQAKLERLPWAVELLRTIAAQAGVRAPDLAAAAGLPTPNFKARVRRLKELGLTESLIIGYRLSPRGQTLLAALSHR
ncbi:hypothetical protein [Nannocystis punicea]|uniref:ASCH domain-containing protein n=1 Tax=Nannocystis punicea TaxID=2995304 RepID=A0ABY7H542_9BACT|nr:hypothetical protein [Nannocystis poenicansa]WAS94232.1 hypothetical protein O0S08_49550 [Nannocystis poenicansa]